MNSRSNRLYVMIAVVAVVALYARTLHFSFYWDDFDDLRPWTWGDLWRAFTGTYQPWSREGIYFYRPLTSLYFATATGLFGLNASWLHTIPLITLSVAGALTGAVAARETGSQTAGVLAVVFYVAHPLTASSIGPWIANQYQGLLVIAALCALLAWRRQAETRAGLSVSLTLALIAAAWLKEDGLVLGPAIAAMHLARARWTHDVPPPTRSMVFGLIGTSLLLVLWRAWWLPAQFGYGVLTLSQMAANLSRAWRYGLLWHVGDTPFAAVITCAKAVVLAAAMWLVVARRESLSARLIVMGVSLLAVVNLPLALVSSENRWHQVGLCVVLITTGVVLAVPARRRVLATALLASVLAVGAWERISAFAPCSADTLSHNQWALSLPELPVELRAWVESRAAACASGRYDAFTVPMRDMRWGAR